MSPHPLTTALNALCEKAQPLLDTIASIHEPNAGEAASPPRKLVVGDHRSENYSVLETILNVPFTAKGKLDNGKYPFATEFAFRRSAVRRFNISIRSDYDGKDLRPPWRYEKTFRSLNGLPQMIKNTIGRMQVYAETDLTDLTDCTTHLLRMEISDPNVQSLTLCDLSLFELFMYMMSNKGDKENIITLAVVASDRLHLLEDIMSTMRLHLYAGGLKSTMPGILGVVTKPDLATYKCTDNGITVYGPEVPATDYTTVGGWQYMHVLRNHDFGQDCPNLVDGSYPASLALENRGADSLREKMSKLLLGRVQTQLPRLISDIERSLEEKNGRLVDLDMPSADLEGKRADLLKKAGEFQRLARDAVSGIYSDKFFGNLDDTNCKLRAGIRNHNHAFIIVLSNQGASRKISREDGDIGGGKTTSGGDMWCDIQNAPHLAPFAARYMFASPKPISKSDVVDELEALAAGNQGTTEFLDAPNMPLAVHLFQRQIRDWEAIAKRHVVLVADVARDFINRLARHILGREMMVCEVLLNSYVGPFFEKTNDLLNDKVEELLRPYAEGYALPFDGSTAVQRASTGYPGTVGDGSRAEGSSSTSGTNGGSWAKGSDKGPGWAEKTIDLMEACYGMCLETFTENVISLAVESCLVRQLEHILTPDMVRRMNDDDLKELVCSPTLRSMQAQLTRKILKLEKALDVCREHLPKAIHSEAPPAAEIRVIGIPTKRNVTPSGHDAPQTKVSDRDDTESYSLSKGESDSDELFWSDTESE